MSFPVSSEVAASPKVSDGGKPARLSSFGVSAALEHAKAADGAPRRGGRVWPPERWLVRCLFKVLGNPSLRIILWDGREIGNGPDAPIVRVIIHDRPTLLKLIMNPESFFGDAYACGRVEVQGDLLALLETVYRSLSPAPRRPGRLRRLLTGWRRGPRSNTLAGSRSNIHHHYDIGDEFYRLWLDKEMLYTCAFFPSPETTLEEAQQAKMDLVCRKLWLQPGEMVVEAGCGWGAMAIYMARHCGVTVKAYNVSHEQIKYARRRAHLEGLDGRVEFIEDDYRNIQGRFDAFVSLGMLEHVGPDHYNELGGVIHRCLNPTGRGILHTIGRDWPGRVNAWIERRIFPGAYPPSLGEMMEILEPWSLSTLDVENLRLHYAETLHHWLKRFDAAENKIIAMFDKRFVRAWRLYLVGSIAGFTTGSLQLFQVLFAPHAMNQIPRTRERLFCAGSSVKRP
jgi:cyclopropane-fatty-acyl-phospholipid synthase